MLLLKDMSKNDPLSKNSKLMTFRSESSLELLVISKPVTEDVTPSQEKGGGYDFLWGGRGTRGGFH